MATYINNHDNWKEFAILHPAGYACNLVERNEHFELIVRPSFLSPSPID